MSPSTETQSSATTNVTDESATASSVAMPRYRRIVIVAAKQVPVSPLRKTGKLALLFFTALFAITATICMTSKFLNGSIIPKRPDFEFNMKIMLSPEEMQQIEYGQATLELSLGNRSLSVVVPSENVMLLGDMGIVSGRMSPKSW